MDLILWRHAEAEDGLPDATRALTARGVKQAARMGEWLDANLPNACRIHVSPTVRTLRTAEALGRKFKRLDALAPGGTVSGVLEAVHWPDGREPVLIVGHQPLLGQLAAWLIAGVEQPWTIRKGNVWWISQRNRESAETSTAFDLPAAATGSRIRPSAGGNENYLRTVLGPDLVNKSLAR